MANRILHGVTTAATVANLSLAQPFPAVSVVNRGGGDLFVRTDGTAPVVGADDNWVVPVNQSAVIPVAANAVWEQGSGAARPTSTAVSVISTAAVNYSVVGLAG